MNDDSISENDLEKMIQGLSNQTYGSTVEDHAGMVKIRLMMIVVDKLQVQIRI